MCMCTYLPIESSKEEEEREEREREKLIDG